MATKIEKLAGAIGGGCNGRSGDGWLTNLNKKQKKTKRDYVSGFVLINP